MSVRFVNSLKVNMYITRDIMKKRAQSLLGKSWPLLCKKDFVVHLFDLMSFKMESNRVCGIFDLMSFKMEIKSSLWHL